MLAGGLVYVVGMFVVTMVCNVPRNDALAAVAPASPQAAEMWTAYVASWTAWNHVRTASSIGAAVAFTIAIIKVRC